MARHLHIPAFVQSRLATTTMHRHAVSKRLQLAPFVNLAEGRFPSPLRASSPHPLFRRGRSTASRGWRFQGVLDQRVVEYALGHDRGQGPETGDTGADDGHVWFESGPDTGVDEVPFLEKNK